MSNIQQVLKRNWLWVFYAIFVTVALYTHSNETIFLSSGPYPLGKPIIWLILSLFLIFSLRISLQENFFKSLKKLHPVLWHRQIGLDLYIGLLIPLFLIYLNESSFIVMLFWFVPIFVFANLATLLYLALNYDSIIAHFV